MTNQPKANVQANNEQKFNYFEFMKFQVLKSYFTKKLKGEETNEIEFQIKSMNPQCNSWFAKNKAFKFVEWKSTYDENGREVTLVKIKDIDLDAKAISKEKNKEFKIFNSFDISKAIKSAMKTLA